MNLEHGVFTVSLDFELYWGVRDKRRIEQYKGNLQGVRKAVPEILGVFDKYGIHATWATVGFLFFRNIDDLKTRLPKVVPTYKKGELSPYKYIDATSHFDAVYHFAPELIELIRNQVGQEIGTHTFSHYYCLEEGQSLAQFEADLAAAVALAREKGIAIKSLVFPRNQWKNEYLSSLDKFDILCYRGSESNWIYKVSDEAGQGALQRAFRLIDAYLNISGYNTYDLKHCARRRPFNFPASRFLRPYAARLQLLEGLRLSRIKRAMDDAARNKRMFHLWWHPHNFGANTSKNIEFLDRISVYFNSLRKEYGMTSLNMGELSNLQCQSIFRDQLGEELRTDLPPNLRACG